MNAILSAKDSTKDMKRFTLLLPADYKRKFLDLCKSHKITQSDFVEAVLDNIPADQLAPILDEKRQSKVADRALVTAHKRELMKKLKALSDEDLSKLLELV